MAKPITKDVVKNVARLANIDLNETELETFTKQIAEIIAYVDKLSELDTTGVNFKSQTDLKNIFRKDIAKTTFTSKDATSNRKQNSKDGYIVIKGVLDK